MIDYFDDLQATMQGLHFDAPVKPPRAERQTAPSGDPQPQLDEFMRLCFLAGGTDRKWSYHSGIKAILAGDDPRDVCDALRRNRPEYFSLKTADARR